MTPPLSVSPSAPVPADWRDLWDSAANIHPDARAALRQAMAAGVDPRHLRLIQLADQDGDDAPLFWFGPEWKGARIFNPLGEVSQGECGRVA